MSMEGVIGWLGLNKLAGVAGFLGALVSLRWIREAELSAWQLCITLVGGWQASVYLTPLVMHYLSLPAKYEGGFAFVLGMFSMNFATKIVTTVHELDLAAILRSWLSKKGG